MKTTVRTIILTAASLFAAMSCQKEAAVSETQNLVKAGETIQVSINAGLGDLVAADGTKATAKSVVRLEWADGDKVQAYCGMTKISSGDGLSVTPSANGMFAKLTGTITAPEAGKTITFVYSSGCVADGLAFDFSSQASVPFVAYGTLAYDGNAITDKMVEFKFATSVMKIAAANLRSGTISSATISGINTKVTLTPSDNGAPGIAGGIPGNIATTTNFDASSDGTRAIITVGVVPDNNTARKLTVKQGAWNFGADFTNEALAANISYISVSALEDLDFVRMGGKKWRKMNLGAESETDFGKYYQWGETVGHVCNGKVNGSTFEDGYNFSWATAPFNGGNADFDQTAFDTHKSTVCPSGVLLPEYDAAHVELGGNCRIPTKEDFEELLLACGVEDDDFNNPLSSPTPGQGVYFLAVDQSLIPTYTGTAGLLFVDGEGHRLFFPCAGMAQGGQLLVQSGADSAGEFYVASCWTSTLSTSNDDKAYVMMFMEHLMLSVGGASRNGGTPIRPVSD